jgi:hypothetical protein
MKPYFIKSLHLTVTLTLLCAVCSFGQGNEEGATVDVQYLAAAMKGVLNHVTSSNKCNFSFFLCIAIKHENSNLQDKDNHIQHNIKTQEL